MDSQQQSLINTKTRQRLYNAKGEEVISGYVIPNERIDARPGLYTLHDADGGFVSVESFEIKAGRETVVNFAEYVGGLTITNTRNNQRLYAENGKDILSGYVTPNNPIDVPPGRYTLRDATNAGRYSAVIRSLAEIEWLGLGAFVNHTQVVLLLRWQPETINSLRALRS